jgi:hypothetical protein
MNPKPRQQTAVSGQSHTPATVIVEKDLSVPVLYGADWAKRAGLGAVQKRKSQSVPGVETRSSAAQPMPHSRG